MTPFETLTAVAAPLDLTNVDTDQILPARFLRKPRKDGYEDYLFHDLRFATDGSENEDFVLNRSTFRKAEILVAGANFGGGSSRENAVWGLIDFGIRCVIAADFGEIFYLNSIKNGLLPIRLKSGECAAIRQQLHDMLGTRITVDLPQQIVSVPDDQTFAFEIDRFKKRCLIEGADDVDMTLNYESEVFRFEAIYRARFDWLFSLD